MAQVEIIAANLKDKNNNITIANKKKRVCAYGRVSTDDEEQITSYNSQIKYYTEKIKSNPDWEFVGIYADEGISGTQVKNRTEFQRMIDDALNGKIDIIMTKSISRFARNVVDTLKTIRELRDKKVDVYFEKENIHTIDLDSEMFLTLYSAFAQAESESTSQNVKLGLKAMMKRGEYVGSPDCYGYDWNKETKQLEINEEQAEVVRMIFNWYIEGLGCRRIANKLEEMNIPSYTGARWSTSSISNMIHQEKYVGDLLQNKSYTVSPITHKCVRNKGEREKYYVKDHHTPIISREVWDKVQEISKKRYEGITFNKNDYKSRETRKYAFSGKIKCAFCGTNFCRRQSSYSKKHPTYNYYWTCFKKREHSDACPDSVGISETKLEETFVMIYNDIIKNKHKTKQALIKAIKDVLSDNDYQDKLNNLLKEKEIIEQRLSKIIDMELDDDIDRKEMFIQKERELLNQLNDIKSKISEYEKILDENKGLSKQIKEIDEYFDNYPSTLKKFNREAFENMIECIIVGDYDENGNKLPRVARFVLKTGKEYKFEISKNSSNDKGNSDKNSEVSLCTRNVTLFCSTNKSKFSSFICSFDF